VNQSSSMTNNTNTIKEMPNTYDMAIGNMKNKTTDILRGAIESWQTLMKNVRK